MQMLIADEAQNVAILAIDAGIYQVEPRRILAGPQAGGWAIAASILADVRYVAFHNALAALPEVDISPSVAWPAVAE